MKKIVALRFHNIPLSAHLQFFYRIDARLAAAGEALRDAVAPLLPPFRAALAKEDAVAAWVRKSEFTAAIAAANAGIDNLLVGINSAVRAGRHALTPAIEESGDRVYHMLRELGTTYRKSYDEKAGSVEVMLQHYNGDYAQDVANLGLAMQVQQLQTALDTFNSLLRQRSDERIAKPSYTALEARRELEGAWRPVAALIEANAVAGTSADFATFISHLNPEIERINVEFHRARKDLGKPGHTVIEPVAIQEFTGFPVTPVPEVHYTGNDDKPAVRLFLGSDFTVIYRNNRRAGMATLIVRGKGKYRGKKSVTFSIEN